MPLIHRIPATKPHTIREFRTAATLRYNEGVRLEAAGDRLAAVYLWGYAAEMLLKAAYLRLTGWRFRQPFTLADLENARKHANAVFRPNWWATNLHDLSKWADLLVDERRLRGVSFGYSFARGLRARVGRIYLNWREHLRYRANRPYAGEATQTRDAVRWLLRNYRRL